MTLQEVRAELHSPRFCKYQKYLNSFWTLTSDERPKILSRHSEFREYWRLLMLEMKILGEQLRDALSVGPSYPDGSGLDGILQVEDLETTLKSATYP
jgi:hypothetical protein